MAAEITGEEARERIAQRVLKRQEEATDTSMKPAEETNPVQTKRTRGADFRTSYTLAFKMRFIDFMDSVKEDQKHRFSTKKRLGIAKDCSELFSISDSMASKWYKDREGIKRDLAAARGRRGRGHKNQLLYHRPRGPTPKFAAMESMTYSTIMQKRNHGVKVTLRLIAIWMRQNMRSLCDSKIYDTAKVDKFRCSKSYIYDFLRRRNLCMRHATNNKSTDWTKIAPKVARYFGLYQRRLETGTRVHPLTGNTRPQDVYNMDETPFEFTSGDSRTVDVIGSEVVRVSARPSSDKRFCTIIMCLRFADHVPQPRIGLIFRGKGKRIKPEEKAGYHPDVDIFFQENAWMTTQLMIDWLDCKKKDPAMSGEAPGKKYLIQDNLSAHVHEDSRAKHKNIGFEPQFLPPNCTEKIQAVDRHMANLLKQMVWEMLDDKIALNPEFADAWTQVENGEYPAWKQRVLATNLVGDAWKKLQERKKDSFEKLGWVTGSLVAVRGCEARFPIEIPGEKGPFVFKPIEGDIGIDELEKYKDDEEEVKVSEALAESTPKQTFGKDEENRKCARVSRKPSSVKSKVDSVDESDDELEAPVDKPADDAVTHLDEPAPVSMNHVNKPDDKLVKQSDDSEDESVDAGTSPFVEELIDDTDGDFPALNRQVLPKDQKIVDQNLVFPLNISKMKGMKVFFAVSMTRSGAPGWILGTVHGVPSDPSEKRNGVTMRIACNRRLDDKALSELTYEPFSVCFNSDNYYERWVLLEDKPAVRAT